MGAFSSTFGVGELSAINGVAGAFAEIVPVVIGDVELIRFKLQHEFAGFLKKAGFPYVTMMLGKTVLSEHHPQSSASLRAIGVATTFGIGSDPLTVF